MRRVQRHQRFFAAFLVLFGLGCADEQPPIDRVQPYALAKSHFVGLDLVATDDDPEFWTQATLIDVGYGARQDGLFTSTYAQPMTRIKWQITEDLLIGRVAYERIDNSDGKGLGKATQDGIVAVAFRILSHFDIQRAYNPSTGEQLNVVQENVVDRPWFERTHFRVDWSKNLNVDSYDFDTLSLVGVYGGVTYEPMAFDITDPQDPNAPVFELEGGYFDVTTKAFARPGLIDLSFLGWGIKQFPACFLPGVFPGGTSPVGNCNPIELTLRHSFRRVEDTDYEPADWDGYRFQAYGAFDIERRGYERNYGMTDDRWHRFISRYNIWQRSHAYDEPETMSGPVECFTPTTTPYGADPNRDEDENGTADECESVGNGSRCDPFKQRCTLPYAQREIRPIVWHYTLGSDLDYFDATRLATYEWDAAMRAAIQSARYVECQRVGEACDTRFPMYRGQQEMNDDLVRLISEVTACRDGFAYPELKGSTEACNALAESLGTKLGYDPAIVALAQMEPVVVLCHSPVEYRDPAACGERRLPPGVTAAECAAVYADPWGQPRTDGAQYPALYTACKDALNVRMGDLRYHQVNVIPTPQSPSPWGIYTDSEDPLTGETIAASINVWSWVNDYWGQQVVDKVRFLKQELTTEDITDGAYIRQWSQAAQAASTGGFSPKMTTDHIAERVAAIGNTTAEAVRNAVVSDDIQRLGHTVMKSLTHVRATMAAPSQTSPLHAARAGHAHDTEFEAELLTPMVQALYGVEGLPLIGDILNMVSFLRAANPTLEKRVRHLKEMALGRRGACIRHQAPAPLAMVGLSDALEAKFGVLNPDDDVAEQAARAEKMRRYISKRAHTAVIMHEMGHSIGMRHNFVSSSDAFNYRPQYWQLRTKNGSVTKPCTALTRDGESCVGPRYFDPVTDNESANLITMFMHSSVMDYAGEITQDFMGLGAYDFAATRMFYGDVAAVYRDPEFQIGTPESVTILDKLDNFGGILGFRYSDPSSANGGSLHYAQLQSRFNLIQDCQDIDPVDYIPAEWDASIDGKWHPVLDGQLVAVDGTYTRCKTRPVDYADWRDMRPPTEDEAQGTRAGPAVVVSGPDEHRGKIRVPYGFGTDGWADLGNLSVYRHDNGADAYELFDFFIAKQEVDHIFNDFRRNRSTFDIRSASSRTLGRFNAKMRDAAKGLGLIKNIYREVLVSVGQNPDQEWPALANLFFRGNVIAAGMAFDHFSRMLFRPEAGPHYKLRQDDSVRSTADTYFNRTPRTVVTIPDGPTGYYGDVGIGGRLVENTYATDQGEYNNQFTMNVGSYYEKMYTAMLFTESEDNFVSDSRGDFTDARYRAVSLAEVFPDGYRRLLANSLTGDEFIKGARLAADERGMPLVGDDGYPALPIGWTSWWQPTPQVCFPNRRTTVCAVPGEEEETAFDALDIASTVPIDSQVGWEQQKFLIAWTLLYLTANQKQDWVNMMTIWESNEVEIERGFDNRIEFHDPTGKTYIAKTFGLETIFGRTVQKGIGARILEYANRLLEQAYVVRDGPDLNGDGQPDWYLPVMGETGLPQIKFDASIAPTAACSADDASGCTCASNRACMALQNYVAVPIFMRQAIDAYGLREPSPRGLF
ncbi:MAG: hypothetical protein VX589_09005 [Myxococcota bacterium]|nr:hypothetical protein [Myxococcota bacterium]